MEGNYSLSDIAALAKDNDGCMGGSWWVILLFLFLMNGNGWNGWNRGGGAGALDTSMMARAATTSDVADSQWRQEVNGQLRGLTNGQCSTAYETARMVDGLRETTQAGIASVISDADRNHDALSAQLNMGFAGVSKGLCELGYQMQQGFAGVEANQLRRDLEAARMENQNLRSDLNNAGQSQYILNQLGRYVQNPPCPPQWGCGCGNLA